MKKYIIKLILFLTFVTTTLHSEEPKEVGKASVDATKAAKRREWCNYGIAIAAVVVAAVGLTIIALNDGSHSNSH